MTLMNLIGDKELVQLQQILQGFIGQLEQIGLNLRDTTKVKIKIVDTAIVIEFENANTSKTNNSSTDPNISNICSDH